MWVDGAEFSRRDVSQVVLGSRGLLDFILLELGLSGCLQQSVILPPAKALRSCRLDDVHALLSGDETNTSSVRLLHAAGRRGGIISWSV